MSAADKPEILSDIEVYHDFAYFRFERVSDGKQLGIEMSRRTDRALDDAKREKVRAILLNNRIITFNGQSYDNVLLWYFVFGADNAQMKQASDRIINGRVKYWQVEDMLGMKIPRSFCFTDLIEPQPNAFASQKALGARLHCLRQQDLPIDPGATLTDEDMDNLIDYCDNNDLPVLRRLHEALAEPLAMREALSAEYGMDFRSKSDSQIGEGIIKKVVERETGCRPERPTVRAGDSFAYPPPAFIEFTDPTLIGILEEIKKTQFYVQPNGKVDLPKWLSDKKIVIGGTEYAMGIGGLHSTEANRAVHADDEYAMYDVDVMGFYPQIIINSKMYPPAIGPAFCGIYATIKKERDTLKPKLKDTSIPKAELTKLKAKVEGYKIVGNGVFGKTSSPYSSLYAPHLMIYTTLTGQLSILMLINRIVDAGMRVASANTDGVVILCPREMTAGLDGDRFLPSRIKNVVEQWEKDTGFQLEAVEYQSLYNLSVNTYIAVKPGGKVKRKGTLSNPWRDTDIRGMLMKNPNAVVCSDAVVELIVNGTPIEDTVRGCTDVRDFVSVVKVQGGATWRGDYLGKTVRYYWAKGGEEIFYKDPHPTTGNFKKVSRTDGCRPIMQLPDDFTNLPADIDYDRYIHEAREILLDIGYDNRPPPVKPLRIFKWSAPAWFAIAV